MQPETYRHALTIAFKSWHSLAVGAVLLGISTFLGLQARDFVSNSQTALQGWVFLVIAGYAFISAIYLGSSPLSENHTLTESFPGIFDHFKTFIIGGLFYAVGSVLLANPATGLKTNDQLVPGALALIIGGALLLLSVLIGVAASLVRPKK